jgi:glycerol-3-phosphate dehydrogenase (NAD(P)+)
VGAGAWGTALAQMLASDGRAVRLWAREAALVETINTQHCNPVYLPSAQLAPTITATSDLAAMAALPVLLWVTPRSSSAGHGRDRPVCGRSGALCQGDRGGTGRLMGEVAAQAAPPRRSRCFRGRRLPMKWPPGCRRQ